MVHPPVPEADGVVLGDGHQGCPPGDRLLSS